MTKKSKEIKKAKLEETIVFLNQLLDDAFWEGERYAEKVIELNMLQQSLLKYQMKSCTYLKSRRCLDYIAHLDAMKVRRRASHQYAFYLPASNRLQRGVPLKQ